MNRPRTGMHRLQELVRLHRMGAKSRRVAKLLRMSPNTEREYRKVLAAKGLLEGDPGDLPELDTLREVVEAHLPPRVAPAQRSSVERWHDVIQQKLWKGVKPKAIYDYLRLEEEEFAGSLSAVKRMCRRLEQERGVQAEDVAIPVETDPGQVAQVDFGYVGKLYDPEQGVLRRVWVFVMVLGYSRHMYAQVVFDQRSKTWLRLHIEAFANFGGVVKTVVPDNLKSAVVRAAFGIDRADDALNRSYRELARHYKFEVDPTPRQDPRKKGKVESSVKYVKRSYFKARELTELTKIDEVQRGLERWVREIAGMRDHGTTRRHPLAVFEQEERAALNPLPLTRFELVVWQKAQVHRDSHVSYERRLYSVPWRWIGKHVWIKGTATTVAVYGGDVRIATHSRRSPGPRSTLDSHLPDYRVELRHRSRAYWEERAAQLGPEVAAYIREVFDSDDVLSKLRTVQGIVQHLKDFPPERARAACRRASFYGNYSYQGIKDILRKTLDLVPLPAAVCSDEDGPQRPCYARTAQQLLNLPLERTHEPN